MQYYYSPEVKFLLKNESKERVGVSYINQSFELPQIGSRRPITTTHAMNIIFL